MPGRGLKALKLDGAVKLLAYFSMVKTLLVFDCHIRHSLFKTKYMTCKVSLNHALFPYQYVRLGISYLVCLP